VLLIYLSKSDIILISDYKKLRHWTLKNWNNPNFEKYNRIIALENCIDEILYDKNINLS